MRRYRIALPLGMYERPEQGGLFHVYNTFTSMPKILHTNNDRSSVF